MSRLEILEKSLLKKKQLFDEKLSVHFKTVAQSNGQPLNDKRCGASTMRKWDLQNDSLRTLNESIKRTENAIEIEKSKIRGVELTSEEIPIQILELVGNGTLTQWRKHPNRFFVSGVDKARIIWDLKKKVLKHQYVNQITDKEQSSKFKEIYNSLYDSFKMN